MIPTTLQSFAISSARCEVGCGTSEDDGGFNGGGTLEDATRGGAGGVGLAGEGTRGVVTGGDGWPGLGDGSAGRLRLAIAYCRGQRLWACSRGLR